MDETVKRVPQRHPRISTGVMYTVFAQAAERNQEDRKDIKVIPCL
jgi:hypothetical protein